MTGGLYHIKTWPVICRATQWAVFYMTVISVMKELKWETYLEPCQTSKMASFEKIVRLRFLTQGSE